MLKISKPEDNLTFFDIQHHENGSIITLTLNQPDSKNALNGVFWDELPYAIRYINHYAPLCVIFNAVGDHFSVGLHLKEFIAQADELSGNSTALKRRSLQHKIARMQEGIRMMYESPSVFIAVVNGYCIGAGLDIIAACDLRIASQTARVSLREAKVGFVADLGSLTFLPPIIGIANTKLMAYTARDFTAIECHHMGLFNYIFETNEGANQNALDLAEEIAKNSPFALQGVKKNIHYSLIHDVNDSLDFVATWNAAYLDSPDFQEAMTAFIEKRKPVFKR